MQLINWVCAQSTQKCRPGEANPIPTEGSRSSTNKTTWDSRCFVFPSEASRQEGLSNSPGHWLCMIRLKEWLMANHGKSNLIKVIPSHSFTKVLPFFKVTLDKERQRQSDFHWKYRCSPHILHFGGAWKTVLALYKLEMSAPPIAADGIRALLALFPQPLSSQWLVTVVLTPDTGRSFAKT